ncbi:glycosyltransferase family 1 protein [Romboutsia ilealis]|uniref:Glycosyltransferase family 4 protein n=1 Tax=Romboutsia faecis TaxID=2764597 RepID=A0ABR7JLL2_9FIRM|nr:glycosyltransferase family 4 protein [Romboutsia faecis]MBC5995808.1 glycosyltransferase family 4 protein [Romboutsia faecis]MRN23007.1 glycosyltransferase family 1 protein [Romboutsia ilealis]
MKVMILANSAEGLYKFRKELILEIKNEHDVIVSVPYNEVYNLKLEAIGCKVINTKIDRRGINPISDFKLLKAYSDLLSDFKPDKIITYTIKCNIYGGIASRLKNIEYYPNITGLGSAFERNKLLKKSIILLYRQGLKKAKKVFFENEENKNVMIKYKIVNSRQSVVLNGAGVNLDEFKFYNLKNDEKTIFLFMGRIMKEKGVEELFSVAKNIKKIYPETVFKILGNFEESYKDEIEKLSRDKIIEYYGRVDDVKPYIKSSQCIVLPSYHEGMSNTLLEAASMGRPIITNNISGCREAVNKNKNGFLCTPKDEKDLYIKIKRFIELPFEEKMNMGKESRNHIEKYFNKADVVNITMMNIFNN